MAKTAKRTVAPVQETNSIDGIINRFSVEKANLDRRKTGALSVFRETARELDTVNSGLRQMASNFETLMASIEKEHKSVSQEISDNDAVMKKILDLIGE